MTQRAPAFALTHCGAMRKPVQKRAKKETVSSGAATVYVSCNAGACLYNTMTVPIFHVPQEKIRHVLLSILLKITIFFNLLY